MKKILEWGAIKKGERKMTVMRHFEYEQV